MYVHLVSGRLGIMFLKGQWLPVNHVTVAPRAPRHRNLEKITQRKI